MEMPSTFSLALSCDETVKSLGRLQRTTRQSTISLAWLPGSGDRVCGGVDWLGEYYPHSWMGSPHAPERDSSGMAQKGLPWVRIVGSRKYSQLSAIYEWWAAVAQISKTTDELKVLYFWF